MGVWSVAQTFSERFALPGLARLGFAGFRGTPEGPTLYRPRCLRRVGSRETVQPLFPNYLFLFADDQLWARVADVFGVARLLKSSDERVSVIPEEKIDGIRACEGPDGVIDLRRTEIGRRWFIPGQSVRAIDGPFVGYTGVFEEYLNGGRVAALFSFMGRKSTVVLHEADLEIQAEQPKDRSRRKRYPKRDDRFRDHIGRLA